MEFIYKYPRTRHIKGSNIQKGDEDLKCVDFESIKEAYFVLEEKVDGANVGIGFDNDRNMLLQSRGHFLTGGYQERQFDLLKVWANCHKNELYNILGKRYIMYGEWLYAKHTIFYDNLTNYFMEFDIFVKEKKKILSTQKRRELLKSHSFITSVRVLYEGHLDCLEDMVSYLGRSAFQSDDCDDVLKKHCQKLKLPFEVVKKQTDMSRDMEGIYIKIEGKKQPQEYVIDRLKYVRKSFINTILDSQSHWLDRPLIPNLLKEGVDIFSLGAGGESI